MSSLEGIANQVRQLKRKKRNDYTGVYIVDESKGESIGSRITELGLTDEQARASVWIVDDIV